jgi:EpsI family protein
MSFFNPTRRQALVLGATMGGAALLAVAAKPSRQMADERLAQPLEKLFPAELPGWRADERSAAFVRPATEQGKRYGIYDQVLERIYLGPQGEQVMMSVAFGAEQSVGLQMHRPEVCYPSGGFKLQGHVTRHTLTLAGQPVPVTRLLATMPGRPEPITYWSVLGDEAQVNDTAFRWRQIGAGLRGTILDGMLVRLSSIDANAERAYAAQARLADALVRAIEPAHRVRVIGRPAAG